MALDDNTAIHWHRKRLADCGGQASRSSLFGDGFLVSFMDVWRQYARSPDTQCPGADPSGGGPR